MKKKTVIFTLTFITVIIGLFAFKNKQDINDKRFITHIVDLNKQQLKFYLQNDNGVNYKNHGHLKKDLKKKNQKLVFAMNGGMYLKDGSPQGLYIENGVTKAKIDTSKNVYGNFYLQPNGIFYITKEQEGVVCKTTDFKPNSNITYATQSGPMLVIDNKIHPVFVKDSKHFNVRNGVGVLPNGKLLFAMSKDTITLYDFADFFKSNGCKNALYLDGKISKTYLPKKKWEQLDGYFGVIIAETELKN